MKFYLLIFSLLIAEISFSQVLTINVPEYDFGIDERKMLIVSHISNIDSYADITEYEEIYIILGQNKYHFSTSPVHLNFNSSYSIVDINSAKPYTLYFTSLPIININPIDSIVDVPKVAAKITYADTEQTVVSHIGIELRGGFSQTYPKKTYDIEFWNDNTGDITIKQQFGNLRSDDDWILDALYNEPLRIRSHIAHKLWLDMHPPHYIDEEPDAKSGADIMFIELFLDDEYKGIYALSEQVDKKQLKLKDYNTSIRGELYKGKTWSDPVTFSGLLNYDNDSRFWGGYKYVYPNEDEITDWSNIYKFTDFVLSSDQVNFKENIWSKFDRDNFIDYFIFLNLIRASDNTGKNIYIAKYTTEDPYFYAPWDLDGCLGTTWEGKNQNTTDDILSNGFIDRVIKSNPENVNNSAANRWFDYRTNLLSNENLLSLIYEKYEFFDNHKIYERESLVYPNYAFDEDAVAYMRQWLEGRLTYLDAYFADKLITDVDSNASTSVLFPNPVWEYLNVPSPALSGKEYSIYNSQGKLVGSGINNINVISFSALDNGIYFIKFGKEIFKVIKVN